MATIQNDRDVLLQATSPRYANSSACTLLITADTPVFHVTTGGAGSPSVVNLTANLISIPGTVTWSVVGASSVTPTGNTCTLAFANMTAASATVTATITYNSVVYTDSKVIAEVADGATGTAGSPGTPGTEGTKSITLAAFKWSNAGVGSYAQTMAYTWSTGAVSAYPSGWSASATTSPGTGYTLYMISLVLSDTLSATTTAANWSSATSGSIGYRQDGSIGPTGSPGATGSDGASGVVAYKLVSSSTLPSAPAAPSGAPTSGSWSAEYSNWHTTAPSAMATNDWLFQASGALSGSSYTWFSPTYLATFKVGSLSALSANMGVVSISSMGSVYSTGKTYGGATAGFFLGYDSTAYKFDIGDSTKYLRWDGSSLTFSGDVETSGHVIADANYVYGAYRASIIGNKNLGFTTGVLGFGHGLVSGSPMAGVCGVGDSGGYGVVGAGSSIGVYGSTSGSSSQGGMFYGPLPNQYYCRVGAYDYAGAFYGPCYISGNLTFTGTISGGTWPTFNQNTTGSAGSVANSGTAGYYVSVTATGGNPATYSITSGSGDGVYCQSTGTGYALRAVSSSAHAIYGNMTAGYGDAVHGVGLNGSGVYGSSSSGYAGYFSLGAGVYVNGNLQVGGSMWLYGNGSYYGTWTYASDIRLKENIESISSGLAEVMRLNPVTFTFRHAPGMGLAKGVQIGWVANEVQASLVDKPYVANIIIKDDGDIGLLRIQDNKLIPLLVKAIQELKSEIEELKGVQQ